MSGAAGLLAALEARPTLPALRALDSAGELTRLIPELAAGKGFVQPALHYFDVFEHCMAAVGALDMVLTPGPEHDELREALGWMDVDAALEGEVDGVPVTSLLRLACLLHDVAKPDTATMVDGQLRFPRHGPRGAEMMLDRLPLLGFGENASRMVSKMLRHHLRPRELVREGSATDHAVRRFVRDVEGFVLPLMLLNLCDGIATRGPGYRRENYRRHCGFVNYVVARSMAVAEHEPEPLVTGDDVMAELGLPGGRLLGSVLTSVRRAQHEGTISDRREALALARSVLARLRTDEETPGQASRRFPAWP